METPCFNRLTNASSQALRTPFVKSATDRKSGEICVPANEIMQPEGDAALVRNAADSSVSVDINNINRVPSVLPSSSITVPSDVDVSAKLSLSKTSFAMMAGGGLDIRLTKRITYRLFDTDYYLCRPTSLITGEDVNRNNFRVTTGVNFTWGAR